LQANETGNPHETPRMREMPHFRTSERLRLGTLLALGAVVLHQFRYVAADGHGAGAALAHHGHGHLSLALPILVSIALAIVAAMLLGVALGRLPASTNRGSRAGGRAPFCALLLMAGFGGQELVEGALLSAHPHGLDALVGHGGVAVVPLAALLGLVISLLVGVLGTAERRIAGTLARPRLRPADLSDGHSERDVERLAGFGCLVFGSAQRAPPSLITCD
jgi:hypothetical protein